MAKGKKMGGPAVALIVATKMRAAAERAKRAEPEVIATRGAVVGDVALLFDVRHLYSVEAMKPSKVKIEIEIEIERLR